MAFKAAFYRGTRPGIPGIYNRGVRFWMRGPYSHCELVFSTGQSASASFMDKGVRFKDIDYTSGDWDFIELPDELEPAAYAWFLQHEGDQYDLMGNFRFVVSAVSDDDQRWFCSEAIAAALGFADAFRFEPNVLAAALKTLGR